MYVGKNPDEIVRKKESEHFKTVARSFSRPDYFSF
jgi:hypothetical protein